MTFRTLQGADLKGKTALVRVDFNVPMENGQVQDDTRLRSALPTIDLLSKAGAKVVLLAHFDRPKGKRVPEMSLKPVLDPLSALLRKPVKFADDCIGEQAKKPRDRRMPAGDVALLENTPLPQGEEKNDAGSSQRDSPLGDIYVNDAFSAAHRAHMPRPRASPAAAGLRRPADAGRTEGAGRGARQSAAPGGGMVGGAKVSTKLDLLGNLVSKVDKLVIGGGMANTFLVRRASRSASRCEQGPRRYRARDPGQGERWAAPSTCRSTSWWRASSRPGCRESWSRMPAPPMR
jgi:phosphoglycerate kinase